MKGRDWDEVTAHLNARDATRTRHRRPHRLAAEWYRTVGTTWCLTLCARHHGRPFERQGLAAGVVNALRFYRDQGKCRIYAYSLMPDHLHAILGLHGGNEDDRTDEGAGLRELIAALKSYTTSQIAWKQDLAGKLWQRDFYDHVALNPTDFEEQCWYVLNNPVRQRLVEEWQNYPWSGIMDEWRDV